MEKDCDAIFASYEERALAMIADYSDGDIEAFVCNAMNLRMMVNPILKDPDVAIFHDECVAFKVKEDIAELQSRGFNGMDGTMDGNTCKTFVSAELEVINNRRKLGVDGIVERELFLMTGIGLFFFFGFYGLLDL